MGKPTTWSKFLICPFFAQNALNDHHLKYEVTHRLSMKIWRPKHEWSEVHVPILHELLSYRVFFMTNKPQHEKLLCRVTYLHSFDTYTLHIC